MISQKRKFDGYNYITFYYFKCISININYSNVLYRIALCPNKNFILCK